MILDNEQARRNERRPNQANELTQCTLLQSCMLAVDCSCWRADARSRLLVTPVTASDAVADSAPTAESTPRTAWWPFSRPQRRAIYDSQPHHVTPHPAVARIIVPEDGATAYGSGTLVDVRDQYGLVVTNWHVVRDSQGVVEVVFPDGFRSHARPLKVDSDWDLAALVIWRPPIEPVKLADQPPRPGDLLTIHGYGRGQYRIATGRCTPYYAPHANFPQEMVELDVEARQGDSGGPIFNQRGELAGVLFGAGQGTTLGSFAPRVSNFLATLAPDIGQATRPGASRRRRPPGTERASAIERRADRSGDARISKFAVVAARMAAQDQPATDGKCAAPTPSHARPPHRTQRRVGVERRHRHRLVRPAQIGSGRRRPGRRSRLRLVKLVR